MTMRRIRIGAGIKDGSVLRDGIIAIQQQLKVDPDFPADVEAAAVAAAAAPRLPDLDRTDLPFITIDPPGSMDLDQAMCLQRRDGGYRVYYAIADLTAFVTAGDPIDLEVHRRGETLYGADSVIPLHPRELSEAGASLLPDQIRPAFLWTIDLDDKGGVVAGTVERAKVRSTARLDYAGVQKSIDDGTADPGLMLLKEIGELRIQQEIARGGINLPMPEQDIDIDGDTWKLAYRAQLPSELWNAQISLLTGMVAAQIMLKGSPATGPVGILRTLPPAGQMVIDRLRHAAKGLHLSWPGAMTYADFVRSLDPTKPAEAAMVVACTLALRGAGYTPFHGTAPTQAQQAAVAAEYAHVTAPLRRLVDRYGLATCAALCAGEPIPQWVLDGLDALPPIMAESGHRAAAYEHAVLDLVEALTLQGAVGQQFRGVVLETEHGGSTGQFQIAEPAIEAAIDSADGKTELPVGELVTATLTTADPAARKVRFSFSP